MALKADCGERIALSCKACGSLAAIAACLDLPRHLVVPFRATRSTIAGALNAWERAATATGTPVEAYLRNRGIQLPVPPTIRYLRRQRNWSNGRDYAAMISLVQRSPGKSDPGVGTDLLATGAHFTFLEGGDGGDPVRKAAVDASKLSLGELRQGGVWLKPLAAIGAELTVAEGKPVVAGTGTPALDCG